LIYLQERGLTEYDALAEKATAATNHFNDISDRLKTIETRLGAITALQKYIGNYSKTRDIYVQYRQSGYNKKHYAQHEGDIILHQAAEKHFDSLGLKKLPTMNMLKQEYATLSAEKKKFYQGYRPAREEMMELLGLNQT